MALADADHGLRDMERIGDDPAAVEYDLGGADHVEASVSVDRTERPECLHHRLLTCLRVIDMVDHNIALPQYFLDISLSRFVMGAQISLIVRPEQDSPSCPPDAPGSCCPSPF